MEGLGNAQGEEAAALLIVFLLWRILRVINGTKHIRADLSRDCLLSTLFVWVTSYLHREEVL